MPRFDPRTLLYDTSWLDDPQYGGGQDLAPYYRRPVAEPQRRGIADYAADIGRDLMTGVGTLLSPLGWAKRGVDAIARAAARAQGLSVPDEWTVGTMLEEAVLPKDPGRGGLLDYLPASPIRALTESETPRAALSSALRFGADLTLDPLIVAGIPGIKMLSRGPAVAAKVLQQQPGLAVYAPEAARALRSAVEHPVAIRPIAEFAARFGMGAEQAGRLGVRAEKAVHGTLGASMGMGAVSSISRAAQEALAAGEITPDVAYEAVQGVGEALMAGAVVSGARTQSLARRRALAGVAGVRPTRVLPIDELPDPLQQRGERQARDFAEGLAAGKQPEELGQLPGDLQPYGEAIWRQAREEAGAIKEGRALLERLRAEHQSGEPGVSVEPGGGELRVLQRNRQGEIVAGAQIKDGYLQMIAGGRGMGARESIAPLYQKLEEMGVKHFDALETLSPQGALARRRGAERRLGLPREVLEGQVTVGEFGRDAAAAREEFFQAGLQDTLGVPAYATDGGAPHFYSQLRKVVVDPKTQAAQRGGDWLKFLGDPKRQVKAAELKWSGLDEYLKGRSGERVSRDEIRQFLDRNEVQVEEVESGATRLSKAEALREVEAGRNVWWRRQQTGSPLTVEQLREHPEDAEFVRGGTTDATKFEQYTLPGGVPGSYRELKITRKLPPVHRWEDVYLDAEASAKWDAFVSSEAARRPTLAEQQAFSDQLKAETVARMRARGETVTDPQLSFEDWARGKYGMGLGEIQIEGDAKGPLYMEWIGEQNRIREQADAAKKRDYKSGHFAEPNILAHVRFKEDRGPAGERVLRVEEIQSDWAEVGRDLGFRAEPAPSTIEVVSLGGDNWGVRVNGQLMQEGVGRQYAEVAAERMRTNPATATRGAVPAGPFVQKTEEWTALALKRLLKYAADNGYDKVAWTTGEQQAARYDLSKLVSQVHYDEVAEQLSVFDDKGQLLIDKWVPRGEVARYIGKEAAKKLLEQEEVFDSATERDIRVLQGEGLKVGGEGMKAYYDEIVPQQADKLVRRFGGKVGKTLVSAGDDTQQILTQLKRSGVTEAQIRDQPWVTLLDDQVTGRFKTREQASEALDRYRGDRLMNVLEQGGTELHSVDITPEMRERVAREGFPLFAVDKQGQAEAATNMRRLLLRLYPENSKIRELEGRYEVQLPDKRIVSWRPGVDHIELDLGAFERGYRRKPAAGEEAKGVTYRLPNAAVVEIVNGAQPRVPLHEHWHVLKHLGVLSDKQRRTLDKRFAGNEEAEADAYAEWFERGMREPDTIWQRIHQGIVSLYESVTGQAAAVFREATKSALARDRQPADIVPANSQRLNLNWHLAASDQGKRRKGAQYAKPPADANKLRLERDGRPFFVGPLSFDEWLTKARAWVGEPGTPQWAGARGWYKQLLGEFVKRYGPDEGEKMLGLWAVSQQRASPSEGLQNLLRAEDVVKGFRPVDAPKAGLAHDRLVAGIQGQPLSLGQKLADFSDAVHGRQTRQWVGHDPRGGRPAPVDVHASRDVGFVDDTVVNATRKFFGDELANKLKVDMRAAPADGQYYAGHDFYNRLADHLNEQGVDGGGWTPAEAQAVGWVAQIKMMGGRAEGPAQIFPPSISHVAVELAPGEGSPRLARWESVPEGRRNEVTYRVIEDVADEAARLSGVRLLDRAKVVGGWEQQLNPNVVFETLNVEAAQRYAKIMARALHQTEVWSQRVAPKSRQNAVGVDIYATPEYDFGRREDVAKFWGEALANEPGLGFSRVTDADGVPVVRVIVDNWRQAKGVAEAVGRWAGEREVVVKERPLEVVKTVNDWRTDDAGEGHTRDVRGVKGQELDAFLGRAEESFQRRTGEALGEPGRAAAPEAEAAAQPLAGAPVVPEARGPPAYAVAPAAAPEPPPLGRPLPPGPPRVEQRVESLDDAVREQRQLGIPAQDLNLNRVHRRNWKSLDPEIRKLLVDWDDQKMLKTMERRQLDDYEVQALDAVVRGRREQKDLARLEYIDAQGTPGEDAAWRRYAQSLGDFVALERANVNDGAGTARALAARARLMEAAQTKDRQFLKQVFREIEGVDEASANEMLRMFETGDPRLADAIRAATAGRWKQWQTLLRAFLITPSSEMANTLGNTIVQGIEVADSAAAAGVDWVVSRFRGTQRERYVGEVGAELGGMLEAVPGAMKAFLDERFVQIYKRAWTGEAKKIEAGRRPLEQQVSPFKSKLGRLFATSLDALQAGDELFQAPIARGELLKRAYRVAKGELPPGTGVDRIQARSLEIATEAVNRPEAHAQLLNEVRSSVERRLFRDKPWSIVGVLRNMEKRYPWLTAVLPFVKTPANIARYAIHHSPLGMMTPEFGRAVLATVGKGGGAMTQGQAADVIARRLIGTAAFGMAVGAAKMGKLTGSGPADPNERKALMETGWRPYSIVASTPAGKVYIPYNRFDPVAQVVGVAADIVELPNMRDANDVASKAIGSIAENFTNRTYLKGLVDFTEALNDPLRFAGNYAIGIGEMHIPRQLARVAQAIDPVLRDVRPVGRGPGAFMDRVVASAQRNVPGLTQMLPARYGPTGEQIERPGEGTLGWLMRATSPIQVSPERKGRNLEGLMAQIGYVPAEAKSFMTIRGQQIPLDRQHVELLHKADRAAAYEARRLLMNPLFDRLPDSIEEGGSQSKEGVIRRTYDKHRDLARQEILRSWSFQKTARAELAGRTAS